MGQNHSFSFAVRRKEKARQSVLRRRFKDNVLHGKTRAKRGLMMKSAEKMDGRRSAVDYEWA